MKYKVGLIISLSILSLGSFLFFNSYKKNESPILGIKTNTENSEEKITEELTEDIKINSATNSAELIIPNFSSQTFNNCGPANLAMILNFWGQKTNQQQLAQDLRPFNTPNGGVDDKSVYNSEMAAYAKQMGFQSLVRPNGSIEKIKLFTSNGIPVLVSSWLHQNEDIGHYRLVKGFDESKKVILSDDSYIGPNQEFGYDEFIDMWKPFNYTYLIIYPAEKSDVVNKILDQEVDITHSYQLAITNAQEDLTKDPSDTYAQFNMSTSNYYIGNFSESAHWYEQSKSKLPSRMLWYQYEPILSYQQLGQNQKALDEADKLLNNANTAFSEMYQLKGEIYLKQGNKSQAKEMFEKALFYNKNYDKPKESLKSI